MNLSKEFLSYKEKPKYLETKAMGPFVKRMPTKQWYLYCFRYECGVYVGVTTNPTQRKKSHVQEKKIDPTTFFCRELKTEPDTYLQACFYEYLAAAVFYTLGVRPYGARIVPRYAYKNNRKKAFCFVYEFMGKDGHKEAAKKAAELWDCNEQEKVKKALKGVLKRV